MLGEVQDFRCPECHKDITLANVAYRIAPCEHRFCDTCVDKLLKLKEKVRCAACEPGRQIWLFQNDFHIPSSYESRLRKEREIREEVLREWNKLPSDFKNPEEYEDYLEFIEDLIIRRTLRPDDEETRRIMEQNRRENAELIDRNGRQREKMRQGRIRNIEQEERYLLKQQLQMLKVSTLEDYEKRERMRRKAAELAGVAYTPLARPHIDIKTLLAELDQDADDEPTADPQGHHTISGAALVRSRMPPVPPARPAADFASWDSDRRRTVARVGGLHYDAYYDAMLSDAVQLVKMTRQVV